MNLFNDIGDNRELSVWFPHFMFRVTSSHAVTSIGRLLSVCAHDIRSLFLLLYDLRWYDNTRVSLSF